MYTLLRQKTGYLGFSKGNKSYLIGFEVPRHATLVSKTICKSPLVLLQRHEVDDISYQVNQGVRAFGIDDIKMDDLTIDTSAHLSISKSREEPYESYSLEEMDAGDFLCLPFEKDLGVIMPYQLLEDSPNQYVFVSQIIDPCGQADIFRKHLKL